MTEKKQIKVLAADIGGVIALFKHGAPSGTLKDFADALWYHTKVPSHHWQKFLEIAADTPEHEFILGNLMPKQFYWEIRKIANAYHGGKQAPFPSFQLFKKMWCNIFTPNWELVGILRDLSKVYKIVLVTNLDVWHYDFVTYLCQLDFIDESKSVISYREHVLKPDPAFFELLIERCGVEPCEIFLFDDMKGNIDCAHQHCGIEVHQFIDNQTWKEELKKRNIVQFLDGG